MQQPTPLFVLVLLLASNFSFAQTCSDCRYVSPIFDSVTVTTVKFGEGERANGNMQELYMDIYEPYGDTATNRPVAIFAFGGAFVTGGRDDWYVVLVCNFLARAGYVVASIDYRIYDDAGELATEVASGLLTGVPYHMRIFFRPMQDMRAAVQYLKADYAELGNNYNIDTSRILLGGASSGAITALMVAYCDKESELAELGAGNISPINALGGFNSTTGMFPNYNWNTLGVFQVSGAILNPDWIEPGDIPVISAHGDDDDIVPYKAGAFAGLTLGFFNMYGSYLVDSAARAKGLCSYIYTMEGKNHPSEDFGIEYIKSVVYRLMLRMDAVINGRSFCCPLDVTVTADDTVRYNPTLGAFDVTATVANDNGNAQIKWCGTPCLTSGVSSSISVQPDTALYYLVCIAHEGACQDATLNMMKADSTLVSAGSVIKTQAGEFTMFPHPAANAFFLNLEKDIAGIKELEIYDLTGRLVLTQSIESNTKSARIDVKNLDAGNYIVKLSAQNKNFQPQKLFIAR